jgi:uncharacterized protein YjcR
MKMPVRINEMTSNVRVTGAESSLPEDEISKIIKIVLERIKEDQEHQHRILEESTIRNQASEIEPY